MTEQSGGTRRADPDDPGSELDEGRDLFRAARDRPLLAIGVVFGAGLLLGYLTGGGEEGEVVEVPPRRKRRRRARAEMDPAVLWEHRARRLLRIAREQERELERLRRASGYDDESRLYREEDEDEGTPGAEPGEGLAALLRDGIQRILRSAAPAG